MTGWKRTELPVAALIAGALCLGLATGPAPGATRVTGTTSFAGTLRTAGWAVQVQSDGSLILTRASQPAGSPGTNAGGAPTGDARAAVRQDQTDWTRLRELGWTVETDDEGATLLYPPGTATSVGTEPSAPTPPPATTEQARHEVTKDLDALLATRGWRTRRDPDGSLVLIPLARAGVGGSGPVAAAGTVPAAVQAGRVSLPIDSWSEARTLALSWLESLGEQSLEIGKIREIYRVYLVSILDGDPPHALRHQIAISTQDGRVIVLN